MNSAGMKINCWEHKGCGREPGGVKVKELGVCSATTDTAAHGKNSGHNGGRLCWALCGTLCSGKVQGTFAQKELSCLNCEFYNIVKAEEGRNFCLLMPYQKFPQRK